MSLAEPKYRLNLTGGVPEAEAVGPGQPAGAAAAEIAAREKPPARLNKYLLLLVASICLSLAVPLALGGLKQFNLLQRLPWTAALLLTLLVCASWAFNATRLKLLLSGMGMSLGVRDSALITMSAEFAGVSTPGAVGMAATYAFLLNEMGMTLGKAFGLVASIVVTDLAFFGTLMPLAAFGLIFEASPHGSLKLVGLILLIVAGGAAVLGALYRYYREFYNFLSRRMARVPWLAKRRFRLARGTVEFVHALRTLGSMGAGRLFLIFLVTIGFWLPRYLVLVAVIYLIGKSVPLAYLFVVQGLMNLGGQLFVLPGGGGGVEAGYAALLSPYLGTEALAFTILVFRTYTFYWFLLVGGPIFLVKTGEAARDLLTRRI
jgi:uncharacterized protein (TIRG00374 family)